jgi:hypothetical protein
MDMFLRRLGVKKILPKLPGRSLGQGVRKVRKLFSHSIGWKMKDASLSSLVVPSPPRP